VEKPDLSAAVDACRSLISNRFPDDDHPGAAAMLLDDGTILTGTAPDAINPSVEVCHETEPYCAACWGGRQIPKSSIEAMASYSKSIWPSLPTGVRSSPSQLGTSSFTSLDFAWAQYVGPLHYPSFKQTPQQFRDTQVAAAKKLGLGLVFGMNYLDGGDGSSRINGTYAKDPNLSDNIHCTSSGCYRYAMSANEVKNAGTVFALTSYACGVISWKYNDTFLSRSGMKDAMSAVGSAARSRSRTACKG